MAVAELIEKLQQYPPEHRVFVDGYEGGIDDLTQVNHVFVKLDQHWENYYGRHEQLDPRDGTPDCEGLVLR